MAGTEIDKSDGDPSSTDAIQEAHTSVDAASVQLSKYAGEIDLALVLATEAAEEITDSESRAESYLDICEVGVVAGHNASVSFEQIRQAASEVEDPKSESDLLHELCLTEIALGCDASKSFAQWRQAISEIADSTERARAHIHLADAEVKAHLDPTISVDVTRAAAETITAIDDKDARLQALATINEIKIPAHRVAAWVEFLNDPKVKAELDPKDIQTGIQQLRQAINEIEHPADRSAALVKLIKTEINAGLDPMESFEQAFETGRQSKRYITYTDMFPTLIQLARKVGLNPDAATERVLTSIDSLFTTSLQQEKAFLAKHVSHHDLAERERLTEQEFAEQKQGLVDSVYRSISQGELADGLIDQARQTISKIKDPKVAAEALKSAIESAIVSGSFDAAREAVTAINGEKTKATMLRELGSAETGI